MPFHATDWHQRFTQQARWTRELRQHLFHRLQIDRGSRILEVGCGTGAVLLDLDLAGGIGSQVFGLDLNEEYLQLARHNLPQAHLVAGNGFDLPFPAQAFDLVYCHFLLLWVRDPIEIMREMKRVTRTDGLVLACAEPDYGGRIDYPDELSKIGTLQMKSLARQGAEPQVGRKLKAILSEAGMREVEVGILGGQWKEAPAPADIDLEWKVLREDLGNQLSQVEIDRYERIDRESWQAGTRLLYVPTFYAWGKA